MYGVRYTAVAIAIIIIKTKTYFTMRYNQHHHCVCGNILADSCLRMFVVLFFIVFSLFFFFILLLFPLPLLLSCARAPTVMQNIYDSRSTYERTRNHVRNEFHYFTLLCVCKCIAYRSVLDEMSICSFVFFCSFRFV